MGVKLAGYLVGTEFYGLLIKSRCGKPMLDMREMQEIEVKKVHLWRLSGGPELEGFQVFLKGNLMKNRVRSQKSISLSGGESEYVAIWVQ